MKNIHFKQKLLTIIGFLSICAVIGLVVMVSGIMPINASSGHWEITKWVLDFSKQRSVATHSQGIEVPPLDDAALVLKGAGHYETGCVQCHGSPLRPPSPIAQSMTATPPLLPPIILDREPEELFYVVKHGIKFTGMPAWPAQQRDDEVWAIVAFLLKVPEMEPETYRELVFPPSKQEVNPHTSDVSFALLETCDRCHGGDGLGRGTGAFPYLAGQHRDYLLASLKAYAVGERHSGIMQPVTAILSPEEISQLANHYANLPNNQTTSNAEDVNVSDNSTHDLAEAIQRGQTIAEKGIPNRLVPSCADCHGPTPAQRSPDYPEIAGQSAKYLSLQLQLFKSNSRGGTKSSHLMQLVVKGLTEDDVRDVTLFYESLSAE